MRKLFTLLALSLLSISSQAQQVSIQIDTIYFSPSNPSVGDSIYLHFNGTANCQFAQQGPTYISNLGRTHTLSVCYVGNTTTPSSTFSYSYAVYRANMSGQDTLKWDFFYNKHLVNMCDTVLDMGEFHIQIDPVAVLSQQSPSLAVNWNPYSATFTLDRLNTNADFRLMDMSGRVVQQEALVGSNAEINIRDVQEGIYLVYISDNEGMIYRNKIFINKP